MGLYGELHEPIIASDALLNWGHSVAECPTFGPSAISSNLSQNGYNPQHASEGLVTCGSTTSKESNREYLMHTEIACEQGLWTCPTFKKLRNALPGWKQDCEPAGVLSSAWESGHGSALPGRVLPWPLQQHFPQLSLMKMRAELSLLCLLAVQGPPCVRLACLCELCHG